MTSKKPITHRKIKILSSKIPKEIINIRKIKILSSKNPKEIINIRKINILPSNLFHLQKKPTTNNLKNEIP
jgi:hypothetical protein